MNNAKRPNLNEVVDVRPNPYGGHGGGAAGVSAGLGPNSGLNNSLLHPSGSLQNLGTGSQLAMAGSLNILSTSNQLERQEQDEERLKKVMANMEKDKSLQFRQNTNNRGYGFQQVIANE